MSVLEIKNLSKKFGAKQVIDDISFSIPEGSIFGFIGGNGAGKTTTMKMILGLLQADQGEIKVCDETVKFGETATNKHIGYLADVPEFYHYMRPKEYLRLCGEIAGLSKSEISERSKRLLDLVGLNKVNRKIGGFSRGMKQRLGVAQALITNPKLLILDEPTSALDPIGRKEILDIMKAISSETTVIFSTHILSDVERVCDQVAVLHGGKIVMKGSLAEITAAHATDSLLIEFEHELDKSKFITTPLEPFKVTEQELEVIIEAKDVKQAQKSVYQRLLDLDLNPTKVEIIKPSFEKIYLEVIS